MLDAIQLHRLKPGEQSDVRKLIEAGFTELGTALSDAHYDELDNLTGHYADAIFLVAHAGDRIIGCAAMQPDGHRQGHIARLSVAREWRQHGLGSRLLAALLDAGAALGYESVELAIPEDWDAIADFFYAARVCGGEAGWVVGNVAAGWVNYDNGMQNERLDPALMHELFTKRVYNHAELDS
jgi:GNAT superfamily N-acetyltransferase